MAKPATEILQQASLRRGRRDLAGSQTHTNVIVDTRKDGIDEALAPFTEIIEEGEVEGMEVGLGTDTLHNQIGAEPTKVLGIEHVLDVLRLLLDVGHGKIVDSKLHPIKGLSGRGIMLSFLLVLERSAEPDTKNGRLDLRRDDRNNGGNSWHS